MYSRALGGEIREEDLAPGYLFFGEEGYIADLFVRELATLLAPGDAPEFRVDRFYLDETGWGEILDTARTMPFLFSPWRVLFVRAPEPKPEGEKNREKEAKLITAADGKLLERYFADPAPRTVLIFHLPGTARRMTAPARSLSALPGVVTRIARVLKNGEAVSWMGERARAMGKAIAPAACDRLLEIVGSDLRRLDNELEKLVVFTGEDKAISAAAVDQAVAWVRDFEPYEIANALESGDLRASLLVLGARLEAGERPEQVLARLAGFVRNILTAKVRLAEGDDRKAVFKEAYPQISESFQELYRTKFSRFFAIVDGLSTGEVRRLLGLLSEADARIKSTDAERRTVLESFVFEYCRLVREVGVTSRASGRPWRPGG